MAPSPLDTRLLTRRLPSYKLPGHSGRGFQGSRFKVQGSMFDFPHSALLLFLALLPFPAPAGTSVHTTWLWHLHQPIYWPDKRAGSDHYENAWDTIQAQNAQRSEPNESLTTV